MSALLLIRHGQASFMSADYDVLSERGIEQSRELGRFLAARGQRLDALYVGPLRRQKDTAQHLLEAALPAGAQWPQAIVLDELSEYPAFEIMRSCIPRLAQSDPQLRELIAEGHFLHDRGRFQKVFEHVIGLWVDGSLELESGLLTWREFSDRVRRGLSRVIEAEGAGRSVAIVTSGGPIAVSLQMSLGLSDRRTLSQSFVIANASVTEYRCRPGEMTLFAFNGTAHLQRQDLITYR